MSAFFVGRIGVVNMGWDMLRSLDMSVVFIHPDGGVSQFHQGFSEFQTKFARPITPACIFAMRYSCPFQIECMKNYQRASDSYGQLLFSGPSNCARIGQG